MIDGSNDEVGDDTREIAVLEAGQLVLKRFRVSVVIPAVNEAANLEYVIPRMPTWVHELILVDGDSVDGTVATARALWPNVIVVDQPGRGKGDALRAGFAVATGDIIVMLDADGSTDPAEMPIFVGALLAGADLAKGSRFAQGGHSEDITLVRRIGNLAFTLLTKVVFRNRCTDLCYGYNAFWRDKLAMLRLDADGFEFEAMLNLRALRAGLRVVEVPSLEAKRMHGHSRLRTFHDGARVLRTILREARNDRVLTPRQVALDGADDPELAAERMGD
ncbi:MAG: glycosyltransferase family 2 protein [bacterium]|jgi:glycosyltransferase involved in cell wall biosynthesis|nr:glycosyltransferase family 2 protein [bacterium]